LEAFGPGRISDSESESELLSIIVCIILAIARLFGPLAFDFGPEIE